MAGLRSDLTAARFTVDGLGAVWGSEADAALDRGNRVPALRSLSTAHSARATLAKLFVLGMPVPLADAEIAFPTLGVSGAIELGLVRRDSAVVIALVDLRPYDFLDAQGAGSWWIASDPGELATGRALRTDHVLGVGGASLTLSGLLIAGEIAGGRVESVLDLGTGCGIQALHASRWAGRVVATDVSARALEFARLNAALNAVTNIEFRLGSLFEPVAGERFERIVSNPPFVITPRVPGVPEYEYRDGGMVGDALVQTVVAGAVEHLVPGGIAQLLGNWEYRDGADGLQRALGWAEAADLDAWIIERDRQDPAQYAETWIRDGGTRAGAPDYEGLLGAWLDDFAARQVTGVGFGYLLLRHPIVSPLLRRTERLDAPLGRGTAGLGDHLATSLAAFDWQASHSDAELLATRLRVAGDVTEERSHWPGEADPSVLLLRQGGGFRRELRVGTELAAIVGACDGELSLGAIVTAVAELLQADADQLARATVTEVRELLIEGFLLVGASAPAPSTGS